VRAAAKRHLRRLRCLYVVCDHDNGIGEKGSKEWHNYNIQHRHMTHRESRAAAHLHGGLNAWWALNPNR
jgi:hypothetical protein